MPEELPRYDDWKLATPPRYEAEEPDAWTADDYAADEADRINDER